MFLRKIYPPITGQNKKNKKNKKYSTVVKYNSNHSFLGQSVGDYYFYEISV